MTHGTTHKVKMQNRAEALAAKAKAPVRPAKFLTKMDSQFRRELAEKNDEQHKKI